MTEGKVKWYDKKKGYGFLLDDSGQDVFVHYTCFSDSSLRSLSEGETVVFDVAPGEKGLRAQNLTLKNESTDTV